MVMLILFMLVMVMIFLKSWDEYKTAPNFVQVRIGGLVCQYIKTGGMLGYTYKQQYHNGKSICVHQPLNNADTANDN
jgi:hypothetical protein